MLRDAVDVVPYEPAQSLKHNDTRGKTVRPCHVSIPYPPITVGGKTPNRLLSPRQRTIPAHDRRGRRPRRPVTVREVMPFATSTHHARP